MSVPSQGDSAMAFTKDAAGRYTQVSPAFAACLGRTTAEVVGRTDADLFSPTVAARFRGEDQRAVHTARPVVYEHTVRPAGVLRRFRTVKFPLADGGISGQTEEVTGTPMPTGKRVLVADDNADALDTLAVILELYGHAVRTAGDGLTAFDAAEAFRPEFVILDIGMPRSDGYECGRRIRGTDWGQTAVLVAVTGWGRDIDRQLATAAGFDHHLTKPVDPADLRRILGG